MASNVKDPPELPDLNFYKCHPNKEVKTVICVICESAYHRSDFNKTRDPHYVGKNLVICQEHGVKNITSNTSDHMLSAEAKKIIATIKLRQSEEIRAEILEELQNKTAELHNTTISEEEMNTKDNLLAENILLRKLVDELQDKVQLQKEYISIQNEKRQETKIIQKSYSEALSNIKPKPKRIPRINVKVSDPKQENTMELLTNCLIEEKNIQTKYIRKKNETVIEISCMNTESLKTAESVLNKKLENCEIKIEQQGNPKIKIIGINNTTNMDMTQIEMDINTRNFKQLNNSGKVLHMYTNKRNKTSTVLMEVSPDLYKFIRENNNKVFVGYQCCKAYDLINVSPCYNCGRHGHSATKCKNESACVKCAGNHNVSACDSVKIECVNCIYNNTKYRTNLPTDHLPTDRIKCSILKKKIKKYIDSIDYPLAPTLPTWDETSALRQITNMQANKLLYHRQTKTVKSLANKLNATSATQQKPNTQQTATTKSSNYSI